MWAKLDDGLIDHPKMLQAGGLVGGDNGIALALAVYVIGLTWSTRYLTDGVIPLHAVRTFKQVKDPTSIAAALVESGLWRKNGHGFEIHDFQDFNPSAAKVKRKRREDRDRKRKVDAR